MGGIGLRVQPRKCAVTAGPPLAAAQLAEDLGVQYRPDGVTVCGTPIGSDAYVADVLRQQVISQVDKLMRLPLPLQSQFALLRASLSLRMAHLMRTVPWSQLQGETGRVEQAILNAVAAIFRIPTPTQAGGAEEVLTRALEQMQLPLRHGGFGLRLASALEDDAAILSAAAKGQAAVASGQASCQPLAGAARVPFLATWHRVRRRRCRMRMGPLGTRPPGGVRTRHPAARAADSVAPSGGPSWRCFPGGVRSVH